GDVGDVGDAGSSTSRGTGEPRRGRASRRPRATGRSRVSGTDNESGAVRPGDVGDVGDAGPSTSRGTGEPRRGRASRRPRATGRSRQSGTSSTDSESGTVRPGRGAGRARGGRGSRGGRAAGRARGSRGGRGRGRAHMMSPETSPDDPAPLPFQDAASQTDDEYLPSTSRTQPPTKINKGPGRKHVSDPDSWKKNMAKRGRAEGRPYTSSTSGREHEAAKIGEPCRCYQECMQTKVPQHVIDQVFQSFWKLGDNYAAKSAYLMSAIRARTVKRLRTKIPGKPPKPQYSYVVSDGLKEYEVCRRAFASIHGVGVGKIEKVIRDKKKSTTGTPVQDRRGRAPSVNQISGFRLDHIHEHIQMLQVTASHYSRAHSPHRRYLSSEMLTRNLYDEYRHWLEETYPGEQPVKQSYYDRIFTRNYNIVKRKPKTDVCDVCTALEIKIKHKVDFIK
ncbi:unnamed protein product, partial [Meganyctiphanes norvegica]